MNLGKVKEGGSNLGVNKGEKTSESQKNLKLSQAPYLYPFYPVELSFVMIIIVRFI